MLSRTMKKKILNKLEYVKQDNEKEKEFVKKNNISSINIKNLSVINKFKISIDQARNQSF